MIKLSGAFFRRPDISSAECISHYGKRHGPLLRETLELRRHVYRYSQHDRIDVAAVSATDPDICGVTQLWFNDVATLLAFYSEPRYLAVLRPDEDRFITKAKSLAVIGREFYPTPGHSDAPVRLFRFLNNAVGRNAQDVTDFRLKVYGPAVASDPQLSGMLAGFVQSVALPKDQSPFAGRPTLDGMDEFQFRDTADVASFLERETALAAQLEAARYVSRETQVDVPTNHRLIV
jgi:hypothetical protein